MDSVAYFYTSSLVISAILTWTFIVAFANLLTSKLVHCITGVLLLISCPTLILFWVSLVMIFLEL